MSLNTRSTACGPTRSSQNEFDPRQGVHGQDVQRQQAPLGTQQWPGKLAPAAGRRAQVDDDLAGPEQAILFVQFLELEDGARAIAEPVRLLHVVVGGMLGPPPLGTGAQLLRHGRGIRCRTP
jgi:hypothetical protein